MVATTTVNGHVSRAVAFQARMDIWLGVGRQTPWDEAQLTGTVAAVAGNFTVPVAPNNTITILVDWDPIGEAPLWTVVVTLTSGTRTVSEITNEINAEYQSVSGTADDIAYQVLIGADTFIQLKTPTTGSTARIAIDDTDDMTDIGFAASRVQWGYNNDPPPSSPVAEEVEELAGFKRADENLLVVPDADVAAEIIGDVDGAPGFTIPGGDTTLLLTVDDLTPFTVTFLSGAQTITYVINTINSAYQAGFLADKGYATSDTIASEQVEGPASYVKLTSPNPGGTSLMEIGADDLAAIGFPVGHPDNPSSGTAGGSIYYRDTQWRIVDPGDAYLEAARWVYLEANLMYDDFPLPLDFRQVGWYSGLEALAGHEADDPLLPENRDTATGVLEVIDNRQVVNRSADEYEKIKIIIEF